MQSKKNRSASPKTAKTAGALKRKKAVTRGYRVVYGETIPAWEQTFPTRREADAFAKRHEGMGDVIFSIRKIEPSDPGPHSLMSALSAAEGE